MWIIWYGNTPPKKKKETHMIWWNTYIPYQCFVNWEAGVASPSIVYVQTVISLWTSQQTTRIHKWMKSSVMFLSLLTLWFQWQIWDFLDPHILSSSGVYVPGRVYSCIARPGSTLETRRMFGSGPSLTWAGVPGPSSALLKYVRTEHILVF